MKITRVKSVIPGISDSEALIDIFVRSKHPNQVLVCRTAKRRQMYIKKAVELGMDPKEARERIKTLEMLKKENHNAYVEYANY